jgi:hypothetical protein
LGGGDKNGPKRHVWRLGHTYFFLFISCFIVLTKDFLFYLGSITMFYKDGEVMLGGDDDRNGPKRALFFIPSLL